MKMWIAALLVLVLSSGCVYSLHMNHTSDLELDGPLSEYSVVEARTVQPTVLGMVAQTDYVDRAFLRLQEQCPAGKITGIQTRYSTSHGFFSWDNRIYMRGYCSK